MPTQGLKPLSNYENITEHRCQQLSVYTITIPAADVNKTTHQHFTTHLAPLVMPLGSHSRWFVESTVQPWAAE
jgi:hypothetical protein